VQGPNAIRKWKALRKNLRKVRKMEVLKGKRLSRYEREEESE